MPCSLSVCRIAIESDDIRWCVWGDGMWIRSVEQKGTIRVACRKRLHRSLPCAPMLNPGLSQGSSTNQQPEPEPAALPCVKQAAARGATAEPHFSSCCFCSLSTIGIASSYDSLQWGESAKIAYTGNATARRTRFPVVMESSCLPTH